MKTEHLLFWTAVGLYGVSACSYIFGLISKHEKPFLVGLYSALAGFVPHVVAIGLRWTQTGISPFITISESITFGIFCAVLIFLVFEFSNTKVRPLGVLIMPVAFVMWIVNTMGVPVLTLLPPSQEPSGAPVRSRTS